MSKIRILPDNLANQIAAGEVVERPASVVKELIENAIDAGAKRLQIEVELGGRRLIRISDDGEGMSRDDAVLAFERHATSKIAKLEDLSAIGTLGFRGEALASIASVSKVELITKTEADSLGSKVIIEGGKLIDVTDAARTTGTTVAIRELFFNTPARRKFMRSEATENFHLTNIITHYALAHHEIAFTLTNNGREILRTAPARDLRERAFQIFGSDLIESLLSVNGGRENIATVSGFVSAPRERRSTRDSQYFFINRRFVRDKLLSRALTEGFRAVLPHGVFPIAFLFLDVPLDEVDVNVHPAKTEVRFRRADAVKEVIAEAVRNALRSSGIVAPEISPIEAADSFALENGETISLGIAANESIHRDQSKAATSQHEITFESADFDRELRIEVTSKDFEAEAEMRTGDRSPGRIESPQKTMGSDETSRAAFVSNSPALQSAQSATRNYATLPPVDSALKATRETEVAKLSATKIRPIGQLHDSFIIAVDDEGLLLIDQHVAHERILFDKFRLREGERAVESQSLLIPETLDLSPSQTVAFDYVQDELSALGFSLMRLSGRTIAIKAIPSDLPPGETRNLLNEILETVDREKRGSALENLRDDIAASIACKAAVKINMKLTPEKMQWMIDRLVLTANAITCPHGRPIVLRLTMNDIEKSFHRK